MAQFELHLFGPPRLVRAGHPLNLGLRKALGLLVYLAVTKQPHSRDALATLLWPEEGQTEARGNLRRTLYRINEKLQADLLTYAGEVVALNPDRDLWVDIDVFRQLGLAHPPPGAIPTRLAPGLIQRLEAAAALYTGDFLAGFTLPDSPAFDDWQFFQRDQLRQAFAGILMQLTKSYQADDKLELAIEQARRWLALDPLDEAAHRELMQLFAAADQPGAALRQYQLCARLLDEELGVPPEDATIALFEAIRTRRFVRPQSVEVSAPNGEQQNRRPMTMGAPSHNLQPQSTPFVGREQEVAAILNRLQDPACRLLTLAGPGGSGKTRLAIHAAQQLLKSEGDPFVDGVYFVPLAPLQHPEEIAPAIVNALGLPVAGDKLPAEEMLHYLSDKRILLILDNFEHLLPDTGPIVQLLNAGSSVKLLVTSREALNLTEEWFHTIGGLAFPVEGEEGRDPLDDYDALRLFEQCAHRARADFSLVRAKDAALRICRLVDGMPLALELAAAWLHTLSAEAVADELAQGFEILTARRRNLPERHRSMRAVLAQSWAMLHRSEQRVLARLSVFRGGFTAHAAEKVAGASLLMLATLVEKSLVRTTASGRYQMHELLRQFAAEQLGADPEGEAVARADHSHYYLRFLAENDSSLYSKHQQQALLAIGHEIDNVRVAWDWALTHGELDLIEQAVEPLYRFYWTRCRNREGEAIFTQTLARLRQTAALQNHPRFEHALLRLVSQRALFYQFQGAYDACERDQRMALSLARKLEQQRSMGYLLTSLGVIAGWRGRCDEAKTFITEGRAVFEHMNHRHGVAHVLQELAALHLEIGEFATGQRLAAESLAISQELERPDWTAWAHDTLGHSCFALGDYEAAHHHYQVAVEIFERIGHERGVALGLGGLGLLAWGKGADELVEAQALVEQSLALSRKIGYRLNIASRLGMIAAILNARQEYAAAQRHAEEGLMIASELGIPGAMLQNLLALAEAACQEARFTVCRRHLREALLMAANCGLWPALLITFYHVAHLMLRELTEEKHTISAPELLALVTQHPAAWHTFQSRAQQTLRMLKTAPTTALDRDPTTLRNLAGKLYAHL